MLNINNAIRGFNENADAIARVAEQISSGKRILKLSDDPAGAGVLSTLKIQSRSLDGIKKNLSAGASILEVSDKALQVQQTLLSDMRELAIRAKSELLSTQQRTDLQKSFSELQNQLDSTISKAKLFGSSLLDSSATDIVIQTGFNSGEKYTLKATKSDSTTLGIGSASIDLSSTTNAQAAMDAIEKASSAVSANQGSIGTMLIGIRKTEENNKIMSSSIQSSISKIEDADIAELTSKLSMLQSKQQLISSTISITNSLPQYLLNLIK